MIGDLFQPLAFLGEARGDGFAPHFGAGARFVQRRDLVFQRRLQRPQSSERAVEPGIQAIEFAAHGAAQTRRGARGAFIGAEQMFGGGLQTFRGAAHALGGGQRKGHGDEQDRRQNNRGGERGGLMQLQRQQSAPAIKAP